jgi:hypothetical protein
MELIVRKIRITSHKGLNLVKDVKIFSRLYAIINTGREVR